MFYTRGSEDSELYSPEAARADFEHLRVIVCDPCMREAAAEGAVEHGESLPQPGEPLPGEWRYRTWRLPGE